jgi:hypothetical protein
MLGANLNETWFAMAMSFYGSAEYAGFARDNTGYVTDLYNTFFARPPDADGMAFWTSQLSSGLAREALVANFMLSPEFSAFAQSIFGNTAARAEVDVVMDFYRGLLSRLPDSGGFNAWVQYLRAAQCQGSTQVNAAVDALSAAFVGSVEYGNRARGNAQYVSDLYNAFMRRGADLDGQRFWTGRLNFGITRDELRRAFLQSPEFQQRVGAVVTQGCAN